MSHQFNNLSADPSDLGLYDWHCPDVPDRPGFIYVVSSPDMPRLLKVGLTTVGTVERVKQLSANPSTPRPLVLEFATESDAVDYDEWHIHKGLKAYHHGKEWFKVELQIAMDAVLEVVQNGLSLPYPPVPLVRPRTTGEPLLTFSECHGHVDNDAPFDVDRWKRNYSTENRHG